MMEMKLEGLHCATCAAKIEESLKSSEFLREVNFSFATKKLTFESDMDKNDLMGLIQKEVDRIEEGVTVQMDNEKEESRRFSPADFLKKNIWLLSGTVLLAGAVITGNEGLTGTVLYLSAYLCLGGKILKKAASDILKGRLFDENFLMSIATIGAFALGEYREAAAVMLFYRVGETFQDYAVDKSRRSISSLLNIKAAFANLVKENGTVKTDPSLLKKGDRILIKAGEKVPVDGVILKGTGNFDTSPLTGESLPRALKPGMDILSGFININGPVTVEVSREFSDSTVSRILHMVEEATARKAPAEQFITRFARFYTPAVVFSALALALIPPLAGPGTFSHWISRALIFLVISCPCALVLSIPLGYFAGLGRASRQGVLIKGGNYLDALNRIDTFVFDKTGTLTEGVFTVTAISGDETLELAVLLEHHSNHPVARAIMMEWEGRPFTGTVSDIEEISGEGIRGIFKDEELLAGNAVLLENAGIGTPELDEEGTVVHVAWKGEYRGNIVLSDRIRPSAAGLVDHLAKKNIRTVILSGDREEVVKEIAGKLGISEYRGALLPDGKLRHVEKLIEEGRKVLFTGDGINDAPVLAAAHVGTAMGGLGSDAAIEAADMVLMADDLSRLPEALETARRTRLIVTENIIFTLAVKLLFLILGAVGMANMYEAVFADVGVALLAVLNSMRILSRRCFIF